MAISSKASENLNSTLKLISSRYGSPLSREGFFIADDKIIKHSENCFQFWEFAKNINIVTVEDRDGKSFLGTLGNPASSRTDVSKQDRQAYSLLSDTMNYTVAQINTDVCVSYALMNMWSASTSKNFSKQYVEYTQQRVGIDRLIAGWHGTAQSNANTDPEDDPLLKNLSMGWLANMIYQRSDRVLGCGVGDSIMIGGNSPSDATYVFKNLDEAVLASIAKIPSMHRQNLVCLIGDELLAQEQARVYSSDGFIYEKHKNSEMFNSFGNIPRLDCVGFPSLGLVVTSIDNLSIYIKSGTAFRQFKNNVRRERVEDYQTSELAYVVENPNAFYAFNPSVVKVPGLTVLTDSEQAEARTLLDEQAANIV